MVEENAHQNLKLLMAILIQQVGRQSYKKNKDCLMEFYFPEN
jgi:hypothetical protein